MSDQLPPELMQRIQALESAPPEEDFDRASWLWLAILGAGLPAVLLFVGWWA